MNLASERANQKVLFNPFESPRVVSASNNIVAAVIDFEKHLELTTGAEAAEARRWLAALIDTRDNVLDTTRETVEAAKKLGAEGMEKADTLREKAREVGAESLTKAGEAAGRFLGGLKGKTRRGRRDEEATEAD